MQRTLALAAFVLLAGCSAAPAPASSVDGAGWQAGHVQQHSLEGRLSYTFEARHGGETTTRSGDATFERARAYERRVLTTDAQWEGEPVYVAQVATLAGAFLGQGDGGWQHGMLEAVRQSDLMASNAVVQVERPCGSCAPEPRLHVLGEELPPHPLVRFPLAVGDTWTTRLGDVEAFEQLAAAGADLRIEAKVRGTTVLDGPHGRVEAFHIRHTLHGVESLSEALAQLGNGTELNVRGEARLDAYYAPSLGDFVRQDLAVKADITATFREGGERGSARVTFDLQLTDHLDAVLQEPLPDLGLLGALGADAGLQPPRMKPAGSTPYVPGSWVVVQADQVAANSAEPKDLVFRASSSGGGKLRLVAYDAGGNELGRVQANADVAELAVPASVAGQVWAVAELLVDGRPVAWDGQMLAVHHRGATDLACLVAGVAARSPCQSTQAPLGPGAFAAFAELSVLGGAPLPLLEGQFELAVGRERHAQQPVRSGQASVEALVPGDGQLQATWHPTVAVDAAAHVGLLVVPVPLMPPGQHGYGLSAVLRQAALAAPEGERAAFEVLLQALPTGAWAGASA
ncbi:MAG TPA: hypothetical protein VFH47_07780 [Candidatus Thermoplasmatota archaeon]|nr:hypothetical protein [Candidatus Thermoplasmatota archaeon]